MDSVPQNNVTGGTWFLFFSSSAGPFFYVFVFLILLDFFYTTENFFLYFAVSLTATRYKRDLLSGKIKMIDVLSNTV